MLEKKLGSTSSTAGRDSCKACHTGLLAIPVLCRHPSKTCFDQPVCPDHSFSLFLTIYYLMSEYQNSTEKINQTWLF